MRRRRISLLFIGPRSRYREVTELDFEPRQSDSRGRAFQLLRFAPYSVFTSLSVIYLCVEEQTLENKLPSCSFSHGYGTLEKVWELQQGDYGEHAFSALPAVLRLCWNFPM